MQQNIAYELGDIVPVVVGNFSTRGCWLQRPVEGDLRGKQRFFKRASSRRATNKLRMFRP